MLNIFTEKKDFSAKPKTTKRYLAGFLAIFIIGFLFGYFVITIVNYYGPNYYGPSSVEGSKNFWQALLPL